MDPLTHGLVGAIAGKTVGASKRRFWIMTLLGLAPDFDFVFSIFGSWAFWLQHRGITHSLLGIVVQSFLYSWALQKFDKGPFWQRTWQYSLPLTFHIFCDFLTSYGVPLLSPFRFREYSADLVTGLTLIPLFITSVGLIATHYHSLPGWKSARLVLAGWALYLCMAVSGKAYATKFVGPSDGVFTAVPSQMNPFRWTIVYPDYASSTYRRYDVDLIRQAKQDMATCSMPNKEAPVVASMESKMVKHFLNETRWPVARVIHVDKGWNVEWGNILFSSRGMVRGKVLVRLKEDGTIIDSKRIYNFWNPEK